MKILNIGNSVTSIGDGAFSDCSRLVSTIIPSSVTSIGHGAFYNCSRLVSTIIPNSVTSIGGFAFSFCTGLTSITIPNSVTSIENGAFSFCTGLTLVTIPNSVKSIGNYAFYGCTGLTSITIPNSVKSIGNYAFQGCTGLTSITIPNSVTSIGNYAFYSCNALVEIHCKALTPPNANDNTFDGRYTTCILYIPKGAYSSYWMAPIWGGFTNIIEEESTNTAISQIEVNNITVYAEQDAIVIKGADLGDNISVYTESGTLLQSTKATDDITRIKVPINHIYLVKTTGKTFKVAL